MKQVQFNGAPMPLANVYCIGRNYAAHAAELGNAIPERPLVFLKSTSAVRDAAKSAEMAFADEEFHFECELVILCEKEWPMGSRLGETDVAAVGLGVDLTRRGVQNELKAKGEPWALAKSFKGSALLGHFVELASLGRPLANLVFTFSVSGEQRQRGEVGLMLVKPHELLNYLLEWNDLQPGDVVFTGTPAGVGPIRRGTPFVMAIDGTDYRVDGSL